MNYSDFRKSLIGNINKGLNLSESTKNKLREITLKRYQLQPELKLHLSKLFSKPVILLDKNTMLPISEYTGIRNMAKQFNCCHKTINKHIKNKTIFKDIGYIIYKTK